MCRPQQDIAVRRTLLRLGLSWVCLIGSLPMRGSGAVEYVIIVCLDGMGAYYLESYVAGEPGAFPNFLRLQTEGAFTYNARCDYDFSETVPGLASMLTARPAAQPEGLPDTVHHGYSQIVPASTDTFHNAGNPAVPYKASLFDVAHDHGDRRRDASRARPDGPPGRPRAATEARRQDRHPPRDAGADRR